MWNEHEQVHERGEREKPEDRAFESIGGDAAQPRVIDRADSEERGQPRTGEDGVFQSRGGPLPIGAHLRAGGGGLNHDDAEEKQSQHAEGEDIACAQGVD